MRTAKTVKFNKTLKWHAAGLLLLSILIPTTGPAAQTGVPSREDVLAELVKPGNYDIETAIEWCGLLRIREAIPHLEKILKKTKNNYYAEDVGEALTALGRLESRDSIGIILNWLPKEEAVAALKRIDKMWKTTDPAKKLARKRLTGLYKAVKNNKYSENRKNYDILLHKLRDFETVAMIDPKGLATFCIFILKEKNPEYEDYALSFLEKIRDKTAVPFIWDRLEENKKSWNYYCLRDLTGKLDTIYPDWRKSKKGRAFCYDVLSYFKRTKEVYEFNRVASKRKKDIKELQKRPEFFHYAGAEEYRGAFNLIQGLKATECDSSMLDIATNKNGYPYARGLALRNLGELAEPGNRKILSILLEGLKNDHPELIRFAVSGITVYGSRYGSKKAVKKLAHRISMRLIDILNKGGIRYRDVETLADGLICWGDWRMVQPVIAILEKNMYPRERNFLFKVLHAFPHPDSVDAIIRFFPRLEIWEKEFFIKVLAKIKDRKALPLLRQNLKHKNAGIRAYAENAIYQITGEYR